VEQAHFLSNLEINKYNKNKNKFNNTKPKSLTKYLNKFIIGQKEAKKNNINRSIQSL